MNAHLYDTLILLIEILEILEIKKKKTHTG